MKLLALIPAALLLVALPLTSQSPATTETDSATLFAQRGSHATIELSSESRTGFQLRGTLRDDSGRPLSTEIQVVRFEITGAESRPAKLEMVPLHELRAEVAPYAIKQSTPLSTAADGGFALPKVLRPGKYSLQVDWEDVPETAAYVEWELYWTNRNDRGEG